MRSKFKGKYLEVEPLGISHLVFPNSGNHYTWRKVKTIGKKVYNCPKCVGLVHVKNKDNYYSAQNSNLADFG